MRGGDFCIFLSAVYRTKDKDIDVFPEYYGWHPDDGVWRSIGEPNVVLSSDGVRDDIRLRLLRADFSDKTADSVLHSPALDSAIDDVREHHLVLSVMTS